jgi:hypothetical protein
LFILGCGSGSHSSTSSSTSTSTPGSNPIAPIGSSNNVAALVVDAGPPLVASSNPDINKAFVTVFVCAPGSTTNCVTIDHVWVDTGSTGLRIPASLLTSLNLQNVNPIAPVAECVQFLDDSFFWGTVKSADVYMGGTTNMGELASNVPIHVMGDPSVDSVASSIPSSCSTVTSISGSSVGGDEEDTVTTLGANGLLGVGTYQYDCDALGFSNACAFATTAPPGAYYTCTGSGASLSCHAALVPLKQQVRNPVSLFTTDNNGVIIELPSVPVGGQVEVAASQASMVFGIGTQSNNGLGSLVVLPLDAIPTDAAYGGMSTVFNGVTYPNSTSTPIGSVLDSGTTSFYFLDEPTSKIPVCGNFYCPPSTESLTATNVASGGHSSPAQFNLSNANQLLSTSNAAFSDLGAPVTPGVPNIAVQADDGFFDWGLPFFYGRNVYTAIWGVTAPTGVPAGPFWAY